MKILSYILSFLSLLSILTGCSYTTGGQTLICVKTLSGKLVDDYYYAPGNLFSVEVPKLDRAEYVTDSPFSTNLQTVAFGDNYGTLYRVEVSTGDSILRARENLKDRFYNEYYHTVLEKALKQAFPGLKTIFEEAIESGYFAIVEGPGISILGPQVNGKLAFILSLQGNQIIIFSYTDLLTLHISQNELKQYFLIKLLPFMSTFKNQSMLIECTQMGRNSFNNQVKTAP